MRLIKFIFCTLILSATSVIADDQSETLENFSCNYAEGKDFDDVMAVAKTWDKWADDAFSVPYQAFLFTPFFVDGNDFDFDFFWVGVTDTPSQMGRINDEFVAKGADMQKKFDQTSKCSGHSLVTSHTIRSYEKPGEAGYVTIWSCTLQDGASLEEAKRADAEWASWMTDNEIPGGLYRWDLGAGTPRNTTFDFYQIWVNSSLEERGLAMEKYHELDGDAAANKIYSGGIYDCDIPRVWFSTPVGGKS